MNVHVRILFDGPTEEDWQAMRSLAGGLTNDPGSVRVFADVEPDWLAAEFTMPTETQIKAVDKIDRALRFCVENRLDSTIGFPRTAAEAARARRKNERRKALRKARRRGE
jgi:hypothetical protein